MAKEIFTEIEIMAAPDQVWKVLTDFDNYPAWNPFIKLLKGQMVVGQRIKVTLEPPGAKAMTFKPKILAFDKEKEIRWLGNLIIPGLFDGEHKFELLNKGNGITIFRQSEKFSGILVGLFKKMLDINTVSGFNEMNSKLKELAEKL